MENSGGELVQLRTILDEIGGSSGPVSSREHARIVEIFEEYARSCPKADELYAALPESHIEVFGVLVMEQAQYVAAELGLPVPDAEIPEEEISESETRSVEASIRIAMRYFAAGYFATQYFFSRRFSLVPVARQALIQAVDDSAKLPLRLFRTPQLDWMLSYALSNELSRVLEEKAAFPDGWEVTADRMTDLLRIGVRIGTMGSVLWQLMDALQRADERPLHPSRLFISYSAKDRRRVIAIDRRLRTFGFNTWRDEKDILVGQPILDRIREGLFHEVDYAVFALSRASVNSEWVKVELRLAYERELESGRVFVLPVLLEECAIPKELKIKKYVDGRKGLAGVVDQLARAIDSYTRNYNRTDMFSRGLDQG